MVAQPQAAEASSSLIRPDAPLVLNVEGSSSQSEEIILLGEETLSLELQTAIPESEKDIGVIWKSNFPQGDEDGVVAHMPRFSKVHRGEATDEDRARYSREIFRATATPAQKKSLAEDPQSVMNRLISSVHDLGVVLGHFKDSQDQGTSSVNISQSDPAATRRAMMERDYMQRQALDYRAKCNVAEREVMALRTHNTALKASAKLDKKNIEAFGEKLRIEKEKVASQEAELTRVRTELEAAHAAVERLTKEKEEAGPKYLSEFLVSRGFKQAAPYASLNLIRFSMYEELKYLGESFPFLPEHLGFNRVDIKDAAVTPLAGYTWDVEQDKLLKPDGTPLEEELELAEGERQELPYTWKTYVAWPPEIPDPNTVEGGPATEEDLSGEQATPIMPPPES
jgi:hypothetical protein